LSGSGIHSDNVWFTSSYGSGIIRFLIYDNPGLFIGYVHPGSWIVLKIEI
jgi:hypothetical protein